MDINKDKNSPTVNHVLYCGHCRTIFGNMTFPYMAYRVKTVNPQYGMAVNKWFKDVGLRRPVVDELVVGLQKFRSKKAVKGYG